MIVNYELIPKYLPTEKQVWLMASSMSKDGFEPTMQIMRAMEKGDLKYIKGVMYRLCRGCMAYYPLDHFHTNKRYVLEKNYLCKDCVARERRIKKYGKLSLISDVGTKGISDDLFVNLSNDTKEKLIRRLQDE